MAASKRNDSLDSWAEGGLVIHQDGSLSSLDADAFWTRVFGPKKPELNSALSAETSAGARARKSKTSKASKAFDFKRALAGASHDRKKKGHGQGYAHGSHQDENVLVIDSFDDVALDGEDTNQEFDDDELEPRRPKTDDRSQCEVTQHCVS